MSCPPDLDALSSTELKALVVALLERVTVLERTVAAQRDEIARLKGGPGSPAIKPSGMERATQPKLTGGQGKHGRGGGPKPAQRVIHEDRVVKAMAPAGSRFKGYEDFVEQGAHSDDCSHRFRLKPAIDSDRSQPGIPMIPAG